MVLLRGILTVWVCAVGLAAQDTDYTLWAQLLNSSLINDAPTEPQNLDVSKLFIVLFVNNTKSTYKLSEAADAIIAYCLNRTAMFYTHGFIASSNSSGTEVVINNVDDFLTLGCLIILDHHAYTYTDVNVVGSYNRALEYVPDIGIALCGPLVKLHEGGFPMDNFIQLSGHSLGAHIVAVAGECFYNRTGVMLPVIKGFDPAGPGFTTFKPTAKRTECYHCNAGQLGIGLCETTAVFYFNGGVYQTECYVPLLTKLIIAPFSSGCSHLSCQKACTLSAAKSGIWAAAHCSSDHNCKNSISDGTGTELINFVNEDATGNYVIDTGLHDILVIPV